MNHMNEVSFTDECTRMASNFLALVLKSNECQEDRVESPSNVRASKVDLTFLDFE